MDGSFHLFLGIGMGVKARSILCVKDQICLNKKLLGAVVEDGLA